jgi:cobalt-zinc-cadmium efflux system outer membrane protein
MIKPLILAAIIFSSTFATDFETFLKDAVANSPYLKASSSGIERAKFEGTIEQRYENPTLELEAASFDPGTGTKDYGYRASLSQPIRLWGVGNAKEAYADTIVKEAQATHTMQRAEFVRDLSLLYAGYVKGHKYLELASEEIVLAKKIYDVSQERFNAGTISRGKLLQAKVDYVSAENRYEQFELQAYRNYMQLLKMAGVNEEIKLSTAHTFQLSSTETSSSPEQVMWERRAGRSLAMAKINENSIESIDLFAEFEKEPEQDISRIGLSMPLALFNNKSEERRIAQLNAEQSELLRTQLTDQQSMEQRRLKQELVYLERLQQRTERVLETELKLLDMFEESYKVSNTNLLELQNIKNGVIATKKELIDLSKNMQSNIVHLNYLQGAYNE